MGQNIHVTWLVTNSQILSPTHLVSNIRHQHRCNPWFENWNFEKILDEFSENRSGSWPVKLKFRKSSWMNFPVLPIRVNEFCSVACKLLWPFSSYMRIFKPSPQITSILMLNFYKTHWLRLEPSWTIKHITFVLLFCMTRL